MNRARTAAWLFCAPLIVLILLILLIPLGGCATDLPVLADGVDIVLPDAGPHAGTWLKPAPPAREPIRSAAAFDDHAQVAGPSLAQPSPADPHAAKRHFFIAWLRISMPTAGPGNRGTISAVYTPKAGTGKDYWQVSNAQVLCPQGNPSIRGTNMHDIDCGD